MIPRFALILAVAVLAFAAPAQGAAGCFASPPGGITPPALLSKPLLHIHTTDFALVEGQAPFEVNVLVHCNGATLITLIGPEGALLVRGQASAARMTVLNQALRAVRIGFVESCGEIPLDGPAPYQITWFGRDGRYNGFDLGPVPGGCPAAVVAFMNVVSALIGEVLEDPDTEVFPPLAR